MVSYSTVSYQTEYQRNTVQLHNAMIISLFDATATLKRPPSPPPQLLPKQPPTKRRRTLLPYQGPNFSDEDRSIRSARLKRWALTMGRKERERLKTLQNLPPVLDPPRPRRDMDEIACERGVELLSERGGLLFSLISSGPPDLQFRNLKTPQAVDYQSISIQVPVPRHYNMSPTE